MEMLWAMTLSLYCFVAAETQFVETATTTTIMQHDKLLASAQRGLVGEEGSNIKASMKQWEENCNFSLQHIAFTPKKALANRFIHS